MAAFDETLLGEWCGNAGMTDTERARTIRDIAITYAASQKRFCAGLTEAMTADDELDWTNYLISYTHVMVGCPGLLEPPASGILVFGLANTAAVGVDAPT